MVPWVSVPWVSSSGTAVQFEHRIFALITWVSNSSRRPADRLGASSPWLHRSQMVDPAREVTAFLALVKWVSNSSSFALITWVSNSSC